MKQLNIKSQDERAYNLAVNLSAGMDTSINQAVTLALAFVYAEYQDYIEQGGDPAEFEAMLKIKGRDQPPAQRQG